MVRKRKAYILTPSNFTSIQGSGISGDAASIGGTKVQTKFPT
jgi:hypothetical protein